MSRLEKLIVQLCPNGVDYKALGKVCEIKRGKRITKKDLIKDGAYPVISGGVVNMGYYNSYNREAETITIAQYGMAGYVAWQNTRFWANDVCYSVFPKNINNKYLFYFLKNSQESLYSLSNRTAIPYSISREKILSLKIPVPPIEVQCEIVRILDNFTELTAELTARKKQYEYYRDFLLSDKYLSDLTNKINQFDEKDRCVRHTTLGEIGKFTRGSGLQKKDFRENGRPVIHYGQIYTKYGFSTQNTFSYADESVYSKLKKAETNDILMATTSENVEDLAKCVVWLGKEDVGFSGDMYSYRTEENSKYLAYYFQSTEFQRQKEKKVTGTKVMRISSESMNNFTINLPSKKIQNMVVAILDKFQDLLQETTGFFPKEIEIRQKQYEYYRDKLLTFAPACGNTHTHTHTSNPY